MRILISRTDAIGDMVLCLPMAGFLKQQSDYTIHILAQNFVRDIVLASPFVDEFISWDELNSLTVAEATLQLEREKYDVFILVYPVLKPLQLAKWAKIPIRIATSHRWYSWCYATHLAYFSRKKCESHEAILNLKLLKLFSTTPEKAEALIPFSRLQMDRGGKQYPLFDSDRFNLIIHPGSAGSGQEWPLEYYCRLIESLPKSQFKVFITGSAQEAKLYSDYLSKRTPQAILLLGQTDLSELMHLIATADGLIASSTGPVHLAAALGIHTLGLYPTVRQVTRWKPIGIKAEYLAALDGFCKKRCNNSTCVCIKTIRPEQVRERVLTWVN
jgi:heptosyltransferase-3